MFKINTVSVSGNACRDYELKLQLNHVRLTLFILLAIRPAIATGSRSNLFVKQLQPHNTA